MEFLQSNPNFNSILQITPLILFIILGFLLTTGKVAFGWGLGDLIPAFSIWLSLIIYLIYYLFGNNLSNSIKTILPIFFLFLGVYFFLRMSIWRGSEFPWNGNFFNTF